MRYYFLLLILLFLTGCTFNNTNAKRELINNWSLMVDFCNSKNMTTCKDNFIVVCDYYCIDKEGERHYYEPEYILKK